MIMRSLDINDDSVWSQKKDEEFLGDETIFWCNQALLHLTNNIWPDICFAVNLLARFSFSPIKGHWNGVEHMIEYPQRTIDMGLFYFRVIQDKIDAEYLSDPHKTRSQTRYLFSCGGTIISWWSIKQMFLRRNKSPSWSKWKVRLVEINDTPYSENVWFFFKKEYINHNVRKIGDIITRNEVMF